MADNVKAFLTDLLSSIQAGKIYPAAHPGFQEYIQKSFQSLRDILSTRRELTIGIVSGELACGEEIFFDLSRKIRPLLLYLEERGIERIWFHANVRREDLAEFVSILALPKKRLDLDTQEALIRAGIQTIKAGKITAPGSGEIRPRVEAGGETTSEEKAEGTSQAGGESGDFSLRDAAGVLDRLLSHEKIALLDLKFNVLNLLEHFSGSPHRLAEFVPAERRDLSLVIHLLGTSLLSMSFSSGLGYSQEDVAEIGIAALLHDIGRLAAGSRQGTEISTDHSLLGGLILLEQAETLGLLPAVVAAEHHRRSDLKDEARPLDVKLHPVSLLAAICNRYEALIRKGFESQDFSPIQAYQQMNEGRDTVFSAELLDEFFRLMGAWPVGTPVMLSDGRIAIVRQADGRDPFRPRVEVVYPDEQREWISLADSPAGLKIERVLNPFGEGKSYLG